MVVNISESPARHGKIGPLGITVRQIGIIIRINPVGHHTLFHAAEFPVFIRGVQAEYSVRIISGDVVNPVDVADSQVISQKGFHRKIERNFHGNVVNQWLSSKFRIFCIPQRQRFRKEFFVLPPVFEFQVFHIQAQFLSHFFVVNHVHNVAVVFQRRNSINVPVNGHAVPDVLTE